MLKEITAIQDEALTPATILGPEHAKRSWLDYVGKYNPELAILAMDTKRWGNVSEKIYKDFSHLIGLEPETKQAAYAFRVALLQSALSLNANVNEAQSYRLPLPRADETHEDYVLLHYIGDTRVNHTDKTAFVERYQQFQLEEIEWQSFIKSTFQLGEELENKEELVRIASLGLRKLDVSDYLQQVQDDPVFELTERAESLVEQAGREAWVSVVLIPALLGVKQPSAIRNI